MVLNDSMFLLLFNVCALVFKCFNDSTAQYFNVSAMCCVLSKLLSQLWPLQVKPDPAQTYLDGNGVDEYDNVSD